jgi:bifunctional enzyme CysN/CysC
MDLIGYSQEKYDAIVSEYLEFAKRIGLSNITPIPMSAFKGDNITGNSANMPWYAGLPLMPHLESVPISAENADSPFRLPVQWVNRPNLDFRGFCGVIAAGAVRKGDRLKVWPSGKESAVASIVLDGEIDEAASGQSVTITLEDEIDISRGDILAKADEPPGVSDQFETTIVWMNETPLLPGRPYLLKIGARTVSASVSAIKHKVNVNTLEHLAAKSLELNEIGVCNVSLEQQIAFDPYAENKDTGGFILIDRLTNETVAAGLIHFALRRAQNIHWQAVDVDKKARSGQKSQQACVLWFTGLSGAGKSTIANLVEKKLFAINRHTYLLDGDNVRHGLNRDLGFTDVDRVENIRRVGEVAKLMADAGLIVLTAFISPFRAERQMVRDLMGKGEFLEVYVDTPLGVAEQRDVKGLYKKAREGKIKNFTGIDSPYEPPENPELRVNTTSLTAEEAADLIVARLEQLGKLSGDPS